MTYVTLGSLVESWTPFEVALTCGAINHQSRDGGPVATPQSLPFFTQRYALESLRAALPALTDKGRALATRIIAKIPLTHALSFGGRTLCGENAYAVTWAEPHEHCCKITCVPCIKKMEGG